jgi:Zn-dependent peptidase ImmA (M78 family)
MTPFGYLFLEKPPKEDLSVPDFRTIGDAPIARPSPNLVDTIQDMQRRQQWMREYLIEQGNDRLSYVGSVRARGSGEQLAKLALQSLNLEEGWSQGCSTWEEALQKLRTAIEAIGVMVSTSGIVGINTHRTLDPQEFRGFVLCDDFAPLIFVNGADSKSAQMFTLAHELMHIWVGRDGIFNLINMLPSNDRLEMYCNQAAAELLIPRKILEARWASAVATNEPFQSVSRSFKVSPLVAARRALDLQLISKTAFFSFYSEYITAWEKKKTLASKKSGGNFYATQKVRLGRRFAYAVIQSAREGRLLFRDAYELTGLKGATFDKFSTFISSEMQG